MLRNVSGPQQMSPGLNKGCCWRIQIFQKNSGSGNFHPENRQSTGHVPMQLLKQRLLADSSNPHELLLYFGPTSTNATPKILT